jgi:hypothetical protein
MRLVRRTTLTVSFERGPTSDPQTGPPRSLAGERQLKTPTAPNSQPRHLRIQVRIRCCWRESVCGCWGFWGSAWPGQTAVKRDWSSIRTPMRIPDGCGWAQWANDWQPSLAPSKRQLKRMSTARNTCTTGSSPGPIVRSMTAPYLSWRKTPSRISRSRCREFLAPRNGFRRPRDLKWLPAEFEISSDGTIAPTLSKGVSQRQPGCARADLSRVMTSLTVVQGRPGKAERAGMLS